nr:TfpX/TfpZ family type IV pilin accessory protein [Moraxella sp. CTOTU47915]
MSNLPFRVQAFLTHLAISLLIASISIAVVFFVWYPAPLAKAVGVTNIFLMMLAIDVVLGPLLTLIVAKKDKSALKLDLSVIALLQLAALSYGLYNIAITRPTYIAFDAIRFELVQANTIPKADREKAHPPYNKLSFLSPRWVTVKIANNDDEKNSRTFLEMRTGLAPSMRPNLYEPLDNQKKTIQQVAKPLSELHKYNLATDIENILLKYPQADSFLPLKANAVDMTVLIDKKSGGKIVKIVDLRPWK